MPSSVADRLPVPAAGATPATSEFSFDQADFERVRRLIRARAGIDLNPGKQAMVYSRVSRRLRETRHRSFASYLEWLERSSGSAGDAEWQEFVNCLTTNLTSFFREEHHFPVLAQALKESSRRPIRIWCNAASTGEEPYSLAICVAETLGPQADVRILATDIDTNVLATARRGVYDIDSRGLSPERRKRFFLRGTGDNAGLMRVRPELSRMIEFRTFNLIGPRWDFADKFDIVFCRNVMIYFDDVTQRQVLRNIHAAMRSPGLLFVGHSENFTDARGVFVLRGKTVYARVG